MTTAASNRRLVQTASLLLVGLMLPLCVWLVTGWSGVHADQKRAESAALQAMHDEERSLARGLTTRLIALRDAESLRPYFHYQNLFHDPASVDNGASIVPSPLATAPNDPAIETYFQIDARGTLTVPTVNEEVPELNVKDDEGRRMLDTLRPNVPAMIAAAKISSQPAPPAPPTIVAKNDAQIDVQQQVQQQVLPQSAYAQNASANQIYVQLKKSAPVPAVGTKGEVTITLEPLHFALIPRGQVEALLIAVRKVTTPAGELVQGFVVSPEGLMASIDPTRASVIAIDPARSSSDDGALGLSLPSGAVLALAPSPDPSTIAMRKNEIARTFLVRFVPIAFVALLAGALVLIVVARTEQLARTRSRFAATAAHELRTPLAGLQLYGEMLAGDLGDPTQTKQYAQRVADEAARLGRVVTNVLGFSQLERGSLRVQPKRGDLSASLRAEIDRLRPTIAALGATLAIDAPDAVEATYDADAVGQIVQNLVDNAEKYGREAGDRSIAVSLRRAGDVVALSVEDHGPGVARTLRRSLFTPFARGDDVDAPAGIGLGLTLSRALARAQGGDLVCDDVTSGARFVLTLRT
jgi:signal transduction histidine kinase